MTLLILYYVAGVEEMTKVERLDDLPSHKKIITGIHRHPGNSNIILTTSRDGVLKLVNDGKEVSQIRIQKNKILSSALTRQMAILSCHYKLYAYDYHQNMMHPYTLHFVNRDTLRLFHHDSYLALSGQKNIHIINSDKKQLIQTIKTHKPIADLTFFEDDKLMYVLDDTVYRYDLKAMNCIDSFTETNYQTTCIAMQGNCENGFFATGSASGNVHLYEYKNHQRTLLKDFGNLNTSINGLVFSDDYLLMHSNVIKDKLRVAHLPSLSVISTWPTQSTPLGYVECSSFEDNTMIIGNSKGTIRQYQIN